MAPIISGDSIPSGINTHSLYRVRSLTRSADHVGCSLVDNRVDFTTVSLYSIIMTKRGVFVQSFLVVGAIGMIVLHAPLILGA